MIFSHAPAGFIVTYITSKIWNRKLTKKQTLWIFIIGTIFGIIPDIDTFYYYLVAVGSSHRELITHTPFLYVLIFLVLFLIGFFAKNQFLKSVSLVILFTSLAHLLLDSLGSGIAWLYPFDKLLYGLLSFSFLNKGFYGENLSAINFSIEVLIFLILFCLGLCLKFKKKHQRIIIIVLSLVVFIFSSLTLFYFNQFVFSRNSDNYYGDIDSDGIMNMRDRDLDNDGNLNISDLDANDNGKKNIEDIIEVAKEIEGVYYDKTEKSFWGFLSRFGLLNNIDVILKPYDYAGIFLGREMSEDFKQMSENYIGVPEKDYLFQDRVENLYTYCKHKDFLINIDKNSTNPSSTKSVETTKSVGAVGKLKLGDIIFYGKDSKISHVSLLIEEGGIVLDAGIESKVIKTNINKAKEKFGDQTYNCRILN